MRLGWFWFRVVHFKRATGSVLHPPTSLGVFRSGDHYSTSHDLDISKDTKDSSSTEDLVTLTPS